MNDAATGTAVDEFDFQMCEFRIFDHLRQPGHSVQIRQAVIVDAIGGAHYKRPAFLVHAAALVILHHVDRLGGTEALHA